jgi:hypothetical protein
MKISVCAVVSTRAFGFSQFVCKDGYTDHVFAIHKTVRIRVNGHELLHGYFCKYSSVESFVFTRLHSLND